MRAERQRHGAGSMLYLPRAQRDAPRCDRAARDAGVRLQHALGVRNDVDIILVMDDEFRLEQCPIEARGLFDHATAQARYGASIFWVRPGLLLGETLEDFVSHWQIKRDGSKRGIVEVSV